MEDSEIGLCRVISDVVDCCEIILESVGARRKIVARADASLPKVKIVWSASSIQIFSKYRNNLDFV
jgi:hypothetical protein